MTRNFYFMLLVLSAVSCKSKKEITIKNLDTQKWDTLSKGISYISTEANSSGKDSPVYELVAIMSNDGQIKPFTDTSEWNMNKAMSILIDKHPQNSSAGFVRININELMQPDTARMNIYLSEPLNDDYQFKTDSAILASIKGISAVRYTSKAAARKKWLDEGNADWEKVLEVNPLPAMIEVDLDDRAWNASALDSMKTIISDNLKTVSDIQYPAPMSVTGILYHYFEYRKK